MKNPAQGCSPPEGVPAGGGCSRPAGGGFPAGGVFLPPPAGGGVPAPAGGGVPAPASLVCSYPDRRGVPARLV